MKNLSNDWTFNDLHVWKNTLIKIRTSYLLHQSFKFPIGFCETVEILHGSNMGKNYNVLNLNFKKPQIKSTFS